jgi:hypothetical protein
VGEIAKRLWAEHEVLTRTDDEKKGADAPYSLIND